MRRNVVRVAAIVVLWFAGCYGDGVKHCPDVDCPIGLVCDGHGGCATQAQLDACAGASDLTPCAYPGVPHGECQNEVCEPFFCGDGTINPPSETCDNGSANADAPDACRPNCTLPRCGDGIVDTGEICDDGNTRSGDGCSADCRSNETCGNGIVDVGEQCDAVSPVCHQDCTLARCGDGVLDPGEQCDNGAANGNTPDGCRANCERAHCGDGVLDSGEVCDDGNNVGGDHCAPDCLSDLSCGNDVVDPGEECDNGINNGTAVDGCRSDCMRAHCGDGVVDSGEACDDGGANSDTAANACRSTCELPRCGDHVIDAGEVCDDGNNVDGDNCSADCKSLETCGDGIVNPIKNETCDCGSDLAHKPASCATPNSDSGAACNTHCKLAGCGDGTINSPENCEPPSDLGGATCTSIGDYGGALACTAQCVFDVSNCQRCGDGVVQVANFEDCDGAALNNGTCASLGFYGGVGASLSCTNHCTFDTSKCGGKCGDGVVNGTEACDGSNLDGEGCKNVGFYTGSLACTGACTYDTSGCSGFCGDGILNGTEVCDGALLNGKNCETFGFEGGTLKCKAGCAGYDLTSCAGSCGDHVCGGGESCSTCPADCGSCCGNGVCDAGENCSTCPVDCGGGSSGGGSSGGGCCGNGHCDPGETGESCPADCSTFKWTWP